MANDIQFFNYIKQSSSKCSHFSTLRKTAESVAVLLCTFKHNIQMGLYSAEIMCLHLQVQVNHH